MSLEGLVDIVLSREPDSPVQVEFREPADVTRLLSGRSPNEVIRLVPALYSLCGTAHAAAATYALEAASDVQADSGTRRVRECLILMERAREHLLRIALDWPKFNGEPTDRETARATVTLLPAFRAAIDPEGKAFYGRVTGNGLQRQAEALIRTATVLAEQRVFGEELEHWLERRTSGDLEEWSRSASTNGARFVRTLNARFDGGVCAVSPLYLSEFDGLVRFKAEESVPETSLLERRRNHSALASSNPSLAHRYLARLVDLAATLQELRDLHKGDGVLPPPPRNKGASGVGLAETARGRLTHIAVLRDGSVESYEIVSPTRWNFAANGIAFRCLETLPDRCDEEQIELANLVVGAIDPCVAHSVRVH